MQLGIPNPPENRDAMAKRLLDERNGIIVDDAKDAER